MNLEKLHESVHALVCPTTRLGLELVTLDAAEARLNAKLFPRDDSFNARGSLSKAAGPTPWVLLREDMGCAYPVVDGIPILLAPEALTISEKQSSFDLTDPRYAEAYEEMEFYNSAASTTSQMLKRDGPESIIPRELAASAEQRASFPAPWQVWVDTVHDSAALWDAYSHLGRFENRKAIQLGGSGSHVIKFAMAGAAEAWLITPMLGEATIARDLADASGVGDRFRCIVAIAEELPIKGEIFDAVFASGCLHHMVTEIALPEAARILRDGGRFAAVEPWRAPLYAIGTKILGKREDA
ncbi:MAG: methyltransferase domain-containing protein, partial [Pyrinomonadaceae bacterium]